jgi:hypothetical protein
VDLFWNDPIIIITITIFLNFEIFWFEFYSFNWHLNFCLSLVIFSIHQNHPALTINLPHQTQIM